MEDYKTALSTLEEIKERYYDSFKLANLKALCLVNLGQSDQAIALLNRISASLQNNSAFFDPAQEGVCLHNLRCVKFSRGQAHGQLEKSEVIEEKTRRGNSLFDSIQL